MICCNYPKSKIVAIALMVGVTSLFDMSIKEVNKASKEELMQIKGIGEKKVDAIIKERKIQKNFKKIKNNFSITEGTLPPSVKPTIIQGLYFSVYYMYQTICMIYYIKIKGTKVPLGS